MVGQFADLMVPDRTYFACVGDEIADITSDLHFGASPAVPALRPSAVAAVSNLHETATTYGTVLARVLLAAIVLHCGQDKVRHWQAGVREVNVPVSDRK